MAKIYASTSDQISAQEKAHMEVARALAGECPVLLENDGALPLQNKTVALYGRGARRTIKGGTGSGDVNSRFSVSVEEGLKDAGFAIKTSDWLDRNEANYKEKYAAYQE